MRWGSWLPPVLWMALILFLSSDTGSSAPLWFSRKSGAPAATNAAELLELLRVYAKAQYQALLLTCINRLYISVRGHLSDQLREVGFCRQRLDELAGLLRETKGLASNLDLRKVGVSRQSCNFLAVEIATVGVH